MRILLVWRIAFIISLIPVFSFAQNTVTSGIWTDPTVWSGGSVPTAGGTVMVNHPLDIASDLAPTGVWTFNSNATDQPGGSAYKFEPNAGTNTITISAGAIVTFTGGTAGPPSGNTNEFSSGTIDIYGTLILGYTTFKNNANLNVNIKPGGTLIINGDLTSGNNSGTFVIDGALIVNGNLDVSSGSVTLSGGGTIETTGTITSNGGSTIFGSKNDCNTGPCSGSSLACQFTNSLGVTNKTICSGSSGGTLTSTTNATSPVRQWQSSTDGVNFTNIGGATGTTYTTPTLTVNTWYRVTVTGADCSTGPTVSGSSNSSPVKITVLSGGGWIGASSTAWSTASNWCTGVPTASTDVVILNSSSISFMPTISAGTAALCKDLVISNTFPSSSVTLASGASSLSISGNFTNNGTLTDNSTGSTNGVKLVGTTAQTLSGTVAANFNNLTISNSSGLTPAVSFSNNNLAVRNNLTLTAGSTNLNSLTITLGTSAGSPGTLAFTSGRFYGGNIVRWFPITAITIPAVTGLFPIGTSSDFRPLYLGHGVLSAGGTIKVGHSSSAGATAVSPTFIDNGGTVMVRSNSFWTVSTSNGLGTGTHTLRTEGTGFGTVADVNHLRMTLSNSLAPGADGAHGGTTTNPQVNRSGLTTPNLSNSFYWGSIDAINTPLPIKLISFSGRFVQEGVDLRWSTASQENFDHFQVERSTNGLDFSPVQQISGEAISTSVAKYNFLDREVKTGKYYYRLKSVDRDGAFDYSKIIALEKQKEISVLIYPNPINNNDEITLLLDSDLSNGGSAKIYDTLGRMMMDQMLMEGENQLNTADFPSGIYFVQVTIGLERFTSRIVIR